jgi:hypothetical protein
MRSRSCLLRNFDTTSAPKVNETPRSFSPHPWTSLSGSDQRRSHNRPEMVNAFGYDVFRWKNTFSIKLTSVWHVCRSHDSPDLLHGLEVWAKATVTTKYFLIHYGGDWQTVKAISESLPKFDVEASFA